MQPNTHDAALSKLNELNQRPDLPPSTRMEINRQVAAVQLARHLGARCPEVHEPR
jgi:hypothetical protein